MDIRQFSRVWIPVPFLLAFWVGCGWGDGPDTTLGRVCASDAICGTGLHCPAGVCVEQVWPPTGPGTDTPDEIAPPEPSEPPGSIAPPGPRELSDPIYLPGPTEPADPPDPTEPTDPWSADPWPSDLDTIFVRLQSDEHDWVGGGRTYEYTPANATFSSTSTEVRFSIDVEPDDGGWWTGTFEVPNSLEQLTPGHYDGLTRFPFHDREVGGLDWWGMGNACNRLTGWFTIESSTYDGDELLAIQLRFQQHCEGGDPALRGWIRWAR